MTRRIIVRGTAQPGRAFVVLVAVLLASTVLWVPVRAGAADPRHSTAASPPAITGVSPKVGRAVGGQTVTITGSGLSGATQVRFSALDADIKSSTDDTVVVTAPQHRAGTVSIRVTTPSGTSPLVAADRYTYYYQPEVTGVSPNTGPTSGGQTVTITGNDLSGETSVMFSGVAATVLSANPTTVSVLTPAHPIATVNVKVTTLGGTSASVEADKYRYYYRPEVTGVSPNSGPTSGGQTVTITGTNLGGGTSVMFSGVAATVLSAKPTTVRVLTPAHSIATVNVKVTTMGGTSAIVEADKYRFR